MSQPTQQINHDAVIRAQAETIQDLVTLLLGARVRAHDLGMRLQAAEQAMKQMAEAPQQFPFSMEKE